MIRQATASINRFSQAIASRENVIFTDTLQPLQQTPFSCSGCQAAEPSSEPGNPRGLKPLARYTITENALIRIETLSQSREELVANLPRYLHGFESGVELYVGGNLNIDDLLKRRENVFDQQDEISRLTFFVGANVAELCTATGKYFELRERRNGG